MTITARTSDGGLVTTKPTECSRCNGNMLMWMAGFGWAACGHCEGTGVEPPPETEEVD